MYFSYILKSLKDNRYYYGSTKDLENRVQKHNKRKVRSTKSRVPFVLRFREKFNTREEAVQREKFYKSMGGYWWLKSKNII